QDSRDRMAGYRYAMEEAGLGAQATVVEATGSTVQAGEAAFSAFLGASRPTAVFACNDPLAIGVVRAARAAGWRVPDDLSVVGFDGTLLAEVCDPPLATVVQPIEEMGKTAVALLHERLTCETTTPRKVVVQPLLREAASASVPSDVHRTEEGV
ncbi:MAG TPA: substrate-binding domain-containing protein, partial [Limnochordia bacterium]